MSKDISSSLPAIFAACRNFSSQEKLKLTADNQNIFCGGSREGARVPLILGKKEEIAEGRKAGRASRTKPSQPPPPPPPALSLRSGFTTDFVF